MHLVYQPIVRLRDRQVVSAEALLRWRDPTGGELSPDQFIGDAEREGMVGALGLFVLRSACAQLAAWRRDGQTALPVSINVSARQFRLPDLSLSFAAALREYQIDPQWLRLEITESAIVDEPDIAAARIAELRALGISIAIDDFGVGYSSLSRLRQYPIDTLKIDHSFVRDIATDHVAREVAGAVIMLAHKLGMTVVAEGVETEAQYDTLVALGCDCGQGFLLGRPLPPNELAALLAAG
jgi:EAL domain-containing protein (putative c-di-GMP-specific phosphodiesterase class I)